MAQAPQQELVKLDPAEQVSALVRLAFLNCDKTIAEKKQAELKRRNLLGQQEAIEAARLSFHVALTHLKEVRNQLESDSNKVVDGIIVFDQKYLLSSKNAMTAVLNSIDNFLKVTYQTAEHYQYDIVHLDKLTNSLNATSTLLKNQTPENFAAFQKQLPSTVREDNLKGWGEALFAVGATLLVVGILTIEISMIALAGMIAPPVALLMTAFYGGLVATIASPFFLCIGADLLDSGNKHTPGSTMKATGNAVEALAQAKGVQLRR
jgi:hypothetical protein